MTIEKTLFTTTRRVPEQGERRWGPDVTDILVDLIDAVEETLTTIGVETVPAWGVTTGSLAAAATLTVTHAIHRVSGDGGAVTLDGTTAISDGTADGQVLVVVGTNDTNTVLVPSGSNNDLNGDMLLDLGAVVTLLWNSSRSLWEELGRNR